MGPATFRQFPGVDPFALLTPTQFLPRRFPELSSAEYAADFNEVKVIGSATSLVRTAEQTQLALLFAGVLSLALSIGRSGTTWRATSHAPSRFRWSIPHASLRC